MPKVALQLSQSPIHNSPATSASPSAYSLLTLSTTLNNLHLHGNSRPKWPFVYRKIRTRTRTHTHAHTPCFSQLSHIVGCSHHWATIQCNDDFKGSSSCEGKATSLPPSRPSVCPSATAFRSPSSDGGHCPPTLLPLPLPTNYSHLLSHCFGCCASSM